MLNVNMGLRAHEKPLVVTDNPTLDEWKTRKIKNLTDSLERAILARKPILDPGNCSSIIFGRSKRGPPHSLPIAS